MSNHQLDQFQGKDVTGLKLQLSGGAKDLTFGGPPQIDQIVRVTIEGRVSGVSYAVNESTGDLEQVVRVKVIEVDDVKELSTPGGTVTPIAGTP